MRDRDRILLLTVVTVPLAWYALSGGEAQEPPARAAAPASSAAPAATTSRAAPSAPAEAARAPAPPGPAVPAAPAVVDADLPVVPAGSGTFTVVPGRGARSGTGPLRTYTVSVEGGLGVDAAAFAATVERTLADPRSWGAGGRLSFQRVDAGPADVQVLLASPTTTDRLCRPLSTASIYSCGNGSRAVLNSMRWLRGADAYAGHLAEYRQYVVNHEVGHTLGHGHARCPGAGQPAPVMVQQTKGVGACTASPWPYP